MVLKTTLDGFYKQSYNWGGPTFYNHSGNHFRLINGPIIHMNGDIMNIYGHIMVILPGSWKGAAIRSQRQSYCSTEVGSQGAADSY